MGAAFLLTYVEPPDEHTDERIDALSNEACVDIADQLGWDSGPGDVPSQVRQHLHDAVQALAKYRRDVAVLMIGGAEYMFTGGMSWGDTPTEAFDLIEALVCADVAGNGGTNAVHIAVPPL